MKAKAKLPKVIKEKLYKKESQKQFWRIFLMEAVLYISTAVLAIIGGFVMYANQTASSQSSNSISLQDVIASFVIITGGIVFFVFYKKAKKQKHVFYKGLFLLACFGGGMALCTIFLPVFASIACMGILLWLWIQKPTVLVHNVLLIFALAGSAILLGLQLGTANSILLLVIFSLYDFVAVYITKHMVQMAKEMVEHKAILGFIIPKDIAGLRLGLSNIKLGSNTTILGGGDIALPIVLVVSLTGVGLVKVIFVSVFSLIGLLCSYYIFTHQDEKDPIPALPPIALLSVVGYLLTLCW